MATAIQRIAKIQFSTITLKFLNLQRNDSANESRTKLASVMPRAACLRNFNCKYTSPLSQIAGHPSDY